MASERIRESKHREVESRPPGVVAGRVFLEDTDHGIPGLVVEAVGCGRGVDTERLGSARTSGRGTFEISVPRLASNRRFLGRHRANRDLQLEVLAPERAGASREGRLLFRSEPRGGAAHREEFSIALSAESLESAGVKVEISEKSAADGIRDAHERILAVQEATDRVLAARMDALSARREFFRSDVRVRIERELSAVSGEERASDRFVPADEDILPRQLAAVAADIGRLTRKESDSATGDPLGKVRLKSRLMLTDEQQTALTEGSANAVMLNEEEVEARLGVTLDKPTAIYRRHLEPDPCRPRTDAERCLEDVDLEIRGEAPARNSDRSAADAEGHVPEPDAPGRRGGADSTGNRAGRNITFDSDTAVARLMRRQSAPEDPVEFGAAASLESPLTAGGVSDAIRQITFAPGPADVPSVHDFHDLQIAFEPVWQEALDGKFLDDVEAAYDQIVERGGDPALDAITGAVGASTATLEGVFFVMAYAGAATQTEVPASVISAVYISLDEWRALPTKSQGHLELLANRIEDLRDEILKALDPEALSDRIQAMFGGIVSDSFGSVIRESLRVAQTPETVALRTQIQLLTADADRIVAHARRLLLERDASKPFKPAHATIEELRRRRSQAYPFRYFAASPTHRSVNFGMVVTYRHQWTPLCYQVGELVKTIPLAPKEIRKFTKKTVIKTKRERKEIESNLVSRRGESEQRSRAEAEIISRATSKTAFSHSTEGTMNFGEGGPVGGSSTVSSAFSRDAERHSESVKKEFREAILKSAEEYRSERKVEVSTVDTFEEEITESGQMENPNDEITVTYMFYELQRRFLVAEKIHRLQSVVLVAQEIPATRAIDNAWLMRFDWILNRVLLDDSFRPALTYVSTTLISEDVVLREMREALFRQRKLVEELKEDVADRRALAGLRYAALQRQIERTAQSAGGSGGFLGSLVGGLPVVGDLVQGGLDLLTGAGGPDEAAQIREGAARDAYDRERREEDELASRLLNTTSALESMQRDYNERLGQHLRQLAQCERLIAHIAQNIMYYMQAIWTYEPDDQRFLRLRNVPVPVFEKDKKLRQYLIQPAVMNGYMDVMSLDYRPYEVLGDLGVAQPPVTPQDIKTRPLSEVADLNRPLGFLGNYMIIPLLESNPITEFMMDPYVTLAEGEYGVSDPDPLGNITLEEFSEYVCCLKRHFERQAESQPSPTDDVGVVPTAPFEELKPYLREILKKLLERSLRNNEQVVVPTDSLYIEALPGAHSVMEKFKHMHRQIDVKSTQEDARQKAIDNVRRAVRILNGALDDPDVDARYVFEGDGTATVVPPGGGGGSGNP